MLFKVDEETKKLRVDSGPMSVRNDVLFHLFYNRMRHPPCNQR